MAPLFDLPAAPAAGTVDVPLESVQTSRADQLLTDIKDNRADINEKMLGEVKMIAEWALEHTVALPEDASTLTERGLDTGLPLAGEGAPLISDFAVLELGAVLGRGVDSTRNYVGQVVELSHRLPLVWARVLDGHVPTWKALRIADCTRNSVPTPWRTSTSSWSGSTPRPVVEVRGAPAPSLETSGPA